MPTIAMPCTTRITGRDLHELSQGLIGTESRAGIEAQDLAECCHVNKRGRSLQQSLASSSSGGRVFTKGQHTFMSDTAMVFSAPLASTMASCAASASNLLGAVTKGRPRSSATALATASAKPFLALSPVPTAVPPCASWYRRGNVPSTLSMPYFTCSALFGRTPELFGHFWSTAVRLTFWPFNWDRKVKRIQQGSICKVSAARDDK